VTLLPAGSREHDVAGVADVVAGGYAGFAVVEHRRERDGRSEGIACYTLVVRRAALVHHPFEVDRARRVLVRRHIALDGHGKVDSAGHVSGVFFFLGPVRATRLIPSAGFTSMARVTFAAS
jgi:hypothetical protein